MKNNAEKLINFIDASASMFHAAENIATYLRQCGFTELPEGEPFECKPHGKYFVNKNSTAIIAWENGDCVKNGFHIIGSHLDSPTFKIKPHPAMPVFNAYTKLNTEVYGGAILSSWFDRPLSIAGRVFAETDNAFAPEQILVDSIHPVAVIPNLAIHMNRDINDGYKYNKQKDMLPLFSVTTGGKVSAEKFKNYIAELAHVNPERILSADLFLNDCTPSTFVGTDKEFFLAGKIDNLGMAFASLEALTQSRPCSCGKMIVVFNNEEVGSATAAGAGSSFLADTLKRIAACEDTAAPIIESFSEMLAASFLISADQAHAAHPNYAEKNDVTSFPIINGGPAVKSAASMSYTSDGQSVAVFKKLCKEAGVPCQDFVNRSDIRGGSTIGPITMKNLHIKSVDIGNPILAMHSVRELGGTYDQEAIVKVFTHFFG